MILVDDEAQAGDAALGGPVEFEGGDRALAVAKTPRSLRYGVKFAQEGDTWVVDGAPTQ